MHALERDQVAAVDAKDGRQQAGELARGAEAAAQGTDHAEELDEGEGVCVDDDPKRKKLAGVHLQGGHEVEEDRKDGDLEHDDGDVGQGVSDAEGGGAVKAEALLAGEDGAAHEGGGGLGHGFHKEVEDGEEDGAGAEEDGFAGLGEVVEEAAADEGLDSGREDLDGEGEAVGHDDLELSVKVSVSGKKQFE